MNKNCYNCKHAKLDGDKEPCATCMVTGRGFGQWEPAEPENTRRMVCGACMAPIADDGCCDCDSTDISFGPLPTRKLTLPTDSAERKEYPLHAGLLAYFPAALAGVARHSKLGNDKHNPGEPLHHARGKSMDHEDCILRHLVDLSDLLARRERVSKRVMLADTARNRALYDEPILAEANALAWRALALAQRLHEQIGGAPLAPGAVED